MEGEISVSIFYVGITDLNWFSLIVVSSTVVVLASALGGNTQIKPDDTDKAV